MTKDDIIRMAQEAGFCHDINHGIYLSAPKHLERFFHTAQAAEREACAKVCDEIYFQKYPDAEEWERSEEGEAIRARGQA
jgi:hypothetical protein